MKLQTIEQLLVSGLRYVYDAEKQLTQALPKFVDASFTPQLKQAFEQHLQQTKEHVGRAEEIFKRLGFEPEPLPNALLEQMRSEADQMIANTDKSALRDSALIVAGNQVEHYQMAAYGSLRSFAQLLGKQDIAEILNLTLEDEKKADARLTQVGQDTVNPQALHAEAARAASI